MTGSLRPFNIFDAIVKPGLEQRNERATCSRGDDALVAQPHTHRIAHVGKHKVRAGVRVKTRREACEETSRRRKFLACASRNYASKDLMPRRREICD